MNDKGITLYGRLGKNPELRRTKKDKTFCTFTLCEHVDGEEIPRWHNIVMWEKESEHWVEVLKKGTAVIVRGHIKERSFTNKNGEAQIYKEINADAIGFTQ